MPKFFAVLPGRADGERPDALPEALEEALDGHDAELDSVKAIGGTITKGGEGTDHPFIRQHGAASVPEGGVWVAPNLTTG